MTRVFTVQGKEAMAPPNQDSKPNMSLIEQATVDLDMVDLEPIQHSMTVI